MAALLALGASPAAAEPAVGIVKGTQILARFDTTSPGQFTGMRTITGVAAGERIVDVDYRWHPNGELNPLPAPQLFGLAVKPGLAYETRLYAIDVETGAATPAGPGFAASPATFDDYAMDFNPTADRIRVINDADLNMRINPGNGARADASSPDSTLNPAGAKVSGLAYDRVAIPIPPSVSGNTTAYAIGANPSDLYTIGGVDSSPSPNSGQLLNPKPLGVTIGANTPVGFDISPSGVACASLIVNGEAGIYTINLTTGAATLVGKTPEPLSGFAFLPPPTTPAPTPISTPTAGVPDKTPPTVRLDGVKGTLTLQAFLKGMTIKFLANEPAAIEAQLLAAPKSARLASFSLILASGSLGLGAGERTLTLKPSRRLVGAPTKAFKVSLRVTATDAAGNAGASTKTIKVRPAAKKPKR
jgi:hypothetical protein